MAIGIRPPHPLKKKYQTHHTNLLLKLQNICIFEVFKYKKNIFIFLAVIFPIKSNHFFYYCYFLIYDFFRLIFLIILSLIF